MTLFGPRRRTPRWTGSTEIVALDPDRCPRCGSPLVTDGFTQEPLLRHGGYGAATATTVRLCPDQHGCGYQGGSTAGEQRPTT